MKFIEEMQRDFVSKKMKPSVVKGFDGPQLATMAKALKFEEPKNYLTVHTPKKGKAKGEESVYLVTNNKWERLCKGSEINPEEVKEKINGLIDLAASLTGLLE